jgi:hypothetical protein
MSAPRPKARQESEPASVFTPEARDRARRDRETPSPEERLEALFRKEPGQEG